MEITVKKVENGFVITSPEGKIYVCTSAYDVHKVVEIIFREEE